MAWVWLGNESAVDNVRFAISEHDPALDEVYAAAYAAGQVGPRDEEGVQYDDQPDAALKAARLSARTAKVHLPGNRITSIQTHDMTRAAMDDITRSNGVVANHFADGTGPVWVESDSPLLAASIAEHYGCPVGRPDGWEPVQ